MKECIPHVSMTYFFFFLNWHSAVLCCVVSMLLSPSWYNLTKVRQRMTSTLFQFSQCKKQARGQHLWYYRMLMPNNMLSETSSCKEPS